MKPGEGLALVIGACSSAMREDRTTGLMREAIAAADSGDASLAAKLARAVLNVSPHHSDAMIVLAGILLHDTGQEASALKFYRQVIEQNPHHSLSAWYLARHELRKGDLSVALALLQASVESCPVDSYAVLTLASILRMMGRSGESAPLIEKHLATRASRLICDAAAFLLLSPAEAGKLVHGGGPPRLSLPYSEALDRLCCYSHLASPSLGIWKRFPGGSWLRRRDNLGFCTEELMKDFVCPHIQNPAMELYKERYGRHIAAHYERTFRVEVLDQEIKSGLRDTNLLDWQTAKHEPDMLPQDMVLVPSGQYPIGCSQSELAHPERKCFVPAFLIDRYPVTNGQWREFRPTHNYPKELENHPVVSVSFVDATLYARWKRKRLPTEIEWEATARGPHGWVYPWGQNPDPQRANCAELKPKAMTPVTRFPTGASFFGACDLVGNAQEWVDELGPSGKDRPVTRVAKGGDLTKPAAGLQCWQRSFNPPLAKGMIGFRCAMDLE